MICEAHTCAGCKYLKSGQDEQTCFAEFLVNCQHAKCKVVYLVRQQMSKLQSTQDKLYEEMQSEISNKAHEALHSEAYEMKNKVYEYYNELYGVQDKAQQIHETQEIQKSLVVASQVARTEDATENTMMSWYYLMSPVRAVHLKWMLQILNRIGYRAHLILAAAAFGVIVWTALVYGVFLGATACGNGNICFTSSLKYAYAKRSLF